MCYKSVSLIVSCYKTVIFISIQWKKVGNSLASYYGTLMYPTIGDNRNCWWCWTMFSTTVELQCVILRILLVILMVLNCILSDYVCYCHSLFSKTRITVRFNYVWIYTHCLCEFCWWIYSIVIMYIVLFWYLHICIIVCTYLILVWINMYTRTRWWTIYTGNQFHNVHRILRQEVGQLARWKILLHR